MEQKNKGRARVKIAVFFVLAIHGIGLLALLMQGCRRDDGTAQNAQTNNLAQPVEPANSNLLAETNPPAVPTPAPAIASVPATTPAAPPATASDYKVAKGDNFTTIGKKFGVLARAIGDANPGVDSTKLQVGQTLHIPAPTPAATPAPTGAAPADTTTGENVYTVKSGDNLTRIATHFGTTVKALQSANNLKSYSIKVGQKLKIPVKAASTTTAALTSAPAETAAANPLPGSTTTASR